MGALNEARLAELKKEQASLRESDPSAPLYRTHYASPKHVAYYLLRVAPELTAHMKRGRSEGSAPSFRSVHGAWLQATRKESDSVHELVPQFYSDPSIFVDEKGVAPFGNVELPPWSGGSPTEFVRLMRKALESEYVSAHLHLWIDLIFGAKQVRSLTL